MAASRGGVQRVLQKLERSVQEGNYYESHQMYRTLYFRYNAQNKYAEAIDLLYTGALTLLNAGQHTSGADLAMLLVDTLNKSSAAVDEDMMGKLSKLHHLIDKETIEKPTYEAAALKWSKSQDEALKYSSGHPSLHRQFALNLWQDRSYVLARYHFLHCSAGEDCASMLVEYHITAGFASEVDLFIAQAVLQFLCLKNKATAEECFRCYTDKHPQVESGPPFIRPLLNFLWLLLLTIDGGQLAVFTVLCEQYQPCLSRDPTYNEYLDRIGQNFFGLRPPERPSQSGLFGNLLQSLLGFDEDEESSTHDTEGATASRSESSSIDLD